jgi:hypothetical protein
MPPEFGSTADAALGLAARLCSQLDLDDIDGFAEAIDEYERTATAAIGAFVPNTSNEQQLGELESVHQRLMQLIDGQVDKLAREMAGHRRGRRVAGAYFTANATIEQQTRSA